jgi:sugar lactone lactonase YvrE
MGNGRITALAAVLVGAAVVAACAAAAPASRLWLVRGPGRPVAGRAASIVVGARPAARTKLTVWIAQGSTSRSFTSRTQSRGRFRARVVFPTAGRWTFGARAQGKRVRLGAVRVRARRVPLTFRWPTSVDVEPDGSLLLAEGGNQTGQGRVLRIDSATGKTRVVARADESYSVAHARSGAVYLSAGHLLLRLDGAGGTTRVAQADGDIGPVAVAPNGDVYFTTQTQIFRVAGGSGPPTPVAGGLSAPHGLAATGDGGLLVSDTGHRRVERVDVGTGDVETWGQVSEPRGIDIAGDGTAYVVDASTDRVVHLMADGRPLASPKHVFSDPYDVSVAADGSLYVVDTSVSGHLYRVAPNGTTSVVSRLR